MKPHLTTPILIPALALLLLAAAFVGWQAVSAQTESVDGLVHLSWDALGDDSVTDVRNALPHQSHKNDPFSPPSENVWATA